MKSVDGWLVGWPGAATETGGQSPADGAYDPSYRRFPPRLAFVAPVEPAGVVRTVVDLLHGAALALAFVWLYVTAIFGWALWVEHRVTGPQLFFAGCSVTFALAVAILSNVTVVEREK